MRSPSIVGNPSAPGRWGKRIASALEGGRRSFGSGGLVEPRHSGHRGGGTKDAFVPPRTSTPMLKGSSPLLPGVGPAAAFGTAATGADSSSGWNAVPYASSLSGPRIQASLSPGASQATRFRGAAVPCTQVVRLGRVQC